MIREDEKTLGIEKFDGTDFGYWKMLSEDYLYRKKLHLPLLGKKPDKIEDAEWTLLDRQVLKVTRSINSVKISCAQYCEGDDHSGSDDDFV